MRVTREVNRDEFIRKLDQRLTRLESFVARLERAPVYPSPASEPEPYTFSKGWWDRTYRWLGGH